MKVAISYTTKNHPELRAETLPRVALNPAYDLHIVDGSDDVWRPSQAASVKWYTFHSNVRGGADAGLAFCLSMMLNHPANYTHVGITEMDVLLDEGWFEAAMALFEKGQAEGLLVGAVSARSFVDRVLIQRDGWAVMHNLGAGNIIFTRQAAELVLRHFRTGFWRDNVRLFAQLSGIDLRTYAAFKGLEENPITTDWIWDAVLARHGLASLALTPSKAQMVGQVPSLKDQGLELTTKSGRELDVRIEQFERYCDNLELLRGGSRAMDFPDILHRDGAGMLVFPHQLGNINANWNDKWRLKWSQGFGPFAYRAHRDGAKITVIVSGPVSFLVTGGDTGSSVTIEDTRSGFKFAPDLPPAGNHPISITVPGGPIPRLITAEFAEGAVFYGLSCEQPQMIDTTFKFDWSQLPEAE